MAKHSPDAIRQHRDEILSIKSALSDEARNSPVLNRLLIPGISSLNRYRAESPQEAIETLKTIDTARTSLENARSSLVDEWNRRNGETSKLPSPAVKERMRKVRTLLGDAWLKVMMHFTDGIKYDPKTDTYSVI
ncbi:MAG: hypothetical protein U0487_03760 [Patescibacteria group bacterium]